MARIDKTLSPSVVRAVLEADIPENLFDKIVAVGINAQGRAVVGAGAAGSTSGVLGVTIPTKWLSKAGAQIDIFRIAEIQDVELVAGNKYFIDAATGLPSATATAGRVFAGTCIDGSKFVLSGFAGVVAV